MQLLRFAPMSEKRKENIQGELEFIQYLRDNGYPALKPVPSKNGELLVETSTRWGDYFASVFERVDGTQLDQLELTDEIIYSYGKSLGKMHSLSVNYDPKVKKWTHEDLLNQIEKELKKHGNTEKAVHELEDLRREFVKIPVTNQNYGLVHYDFEPDNVFYNKELKQCEVIDFEDSMYHWYAVDLEQCFGELEGEMEVSQFEKAKTIFLEGYQSEHTLSEEMKEALSIMRRFINLYDYTRILYSTSEVLEQEPEWLAELRKKLALKMKRLEESMR